MDEQINILIQYLLFLDNRFIVAFSHYVLNTYNGLSTISYKSDFVKSTYKRLSSSS